MKTRLILTFAFSLLAANAAFAEDGSDRTNMHNFAIEKVQPATVAEDGFDHTNAHRFVEDGFDRTNAHRIS